MSETLYSIDCQSIANVYELVPASAPIFERFRLIGEAAPIPLPGQEVRLGFVAVDPIIES